METHSVRGNNGIIGWGNFGTTNQVISLRSGGTTAVVNQWWTNDLSINVPAGQSLLNNWHYLTATYNAVSGVRTLYFDGAVLGSDLPGVANGATNTNFAVGLNSLANKTFFAGHMAELLVANSAISQADILNAMNNGVSFGSYALDGSIASASLLNVAAGATVDMDGTNQSVAGLSDVTGAGGSVTSSFAGPSLAYRDSNRNQDLQRIDL